MPKDNNGGEPQNNNTETFTKEQVQQMISEAVTKANEETDLLNAKLTEIVNKNQELETKFNEATKKADLLEKQATVAKIAKELGLKDKAMSLVQLDAENLEDAVKKVAEDYPELKVNYQVGGSSNPANFNNSSMPNPYKKETFNLTKQAMLEANNPTQAAKFKAEAGLK